jgi:hypothetical protein
VKISAKSFRKGHVYSMLEKGKQIIVVCNDDEKHCGDVYLQQIGKVDDWCVLTDGCGMKFSDYTELKDITADVLEMGKK